MSEEIIHIYTDGASLGNPGPGGWAALIRSGGRMRELSGGFRETTNNRMELYAAIMGLESLPVGARVKLYSDSSYLVQGISQGWAEKWKAKGWKQTRTKPTPNADLWARLLIAVGERQVSWEWVRGHAGHPENERADRLAVKAANGQNLPLDAGFSAVLEAPQLSLFDGIGGQEEVKSAAEPLKHAQGRGKVTQPGQTCRKCGTPVEKRIPSRKLSGKQKHYYAWYLVCPNCGTLYLVDEAKREV